VFQQPFLLNYLTALENILVGVNPSNLSTAVTKAESLLENLGLGGMGDKYPSMLSGGERQRVAVARALIGNPDIVFADEPTANLDSFSSNLVIDIFKKLNKEEKLTIVMVTHEDEYGKYDCPYFDSALYRSTASIINHADGNDANCYYLFNDEINRVEIRALCDIYINEELLCDYGEEYKISGEFAGTFCTLRNTQAIPAWYLNT
jgi:ABC-type arginine transport system ATPase subunit